MTQPDAIQWGVRQEVPIIPDGEMPEQIPAPAPIDYTGMTEEQVAEAEAQQGVDFAAWNAVMAGWYQDVLALIEAHPEWWQYTVQVYPDEATAREQLALTREANQGNAFVRSVDLVTAPVITWTVVEA
ncbi:hypothetical protein I5G59_gp30 [Mycobacterium phage LilMcDreamy]|uniref:Uncharacterized protein n=1 Tax=Mycobacterium phage LilMcDreamy TaxID=2652422 RepID=A0A5P8D986_9CAUD|nr:hypothetical protein I5G59_gp30 [Mycobacterium phage LilMcDreamy]QFP94650.1 hypothetical protein SEA_LILMCDREAMY_30 [Mycobacterium phage LilMcDreamy]